MQCYGFYEGQTSIFMLLLHIKFGISAYSFFLKLSISIVFWNVLNSVPHVLACSRTLLAHIFTCLVCSRARLIACNWVLSVCLNSYMLACRRSCVFGLLACLRARVAVCLRSFRAYFLASLACLLYSNVLLA